MTDNTTIECFEASNGARIARLPVEVFSGYMAFAHLVVHEGRTTLIDVGSGVGNSHTDLIDGFAAAREMHGLDVRPEDLDQIIITHGHIDHFGGTRQFKEVAANARVAIHELARPVLVNYDERVLVNSHRMTLFHQRAGVPESRHQHLLELYMLGKKSFKPTPVDLTLRDGDVVDGCFKIIHVPGHEPGMVMIQIGDVLLTADHILPGTSVALAPESLLPFSGVAHYVDSLEKAAKIEGVRLALGGHEWPMPDYYDVARRTREQTVEKIERVLNECKAPSTIYEIAVRIYGDLEGYSELLKVGQVGARVEYLNQRALVMVDNLDDLERDPDTALRYRVV